MKKLLSVLLVITLFLSMCVLSSGCGICGEKAPLGFSDLKRARDIGILTQEDLLSIAYYHNGGREGHETIMPEDYQPKDKNPGTLSEDLENVIKLEYLTQIRQPTGTTIEDIQIYAYYGAYNGCPAVLVGYNNEENQADACVETVDNVNFNYANSNYILIWRGNVEDYQ